MKRLGLIVGLMLLAMIGGGVILANTLLGGATIAKDTSFIVAPGDTVTKVAQKLEDEGLITSADGFVLRAKLLGSSDPIQTGEFNLTPDMNQGEILVAFQQGDVIRRFITIPEGMPSILVYERLKAEKLLTGDIEVPAEGSILPDTYAFAKGQSRQSLIDAMQKAMDDYLAEAWAKRKPDIAVSTIREALTLASIVEKETGKPSERRRVAGLYSNRVKTNMPLQADPTIIYPITKGKPLGRRIRQSEIAAINGYNTYTRTQLPIGPITNPGRESIAAVLDPEQHKYLFMVADGTGGHVFNETYEGHNEAVGRWYALRKKRGEM
jgi:UPF0755 protein